MASNLNGKRVAILATDGFEQVELTEPKKALDGAGAKTVVVSPKNEMTGVLAEGAENDQGHAAILSGTKEASAGGGRGAGGARGGIETPKDVTTLSTFLSLLPDSFALPPDSCSPLPSTASRNLGRW